MRDFADKRRAEAPNTRSLVSNDLEGTFKLGDGVVVFDMPRWDSMNTESHGVKITFDFDARDGGIPFPRFKEETHVFRPA